VIPKQRIEEPAVVPVHLAPARRQARWRLALGVLMTVGILALAFFNRAWLLEAIRLARSAQPAWLLLGLLTIASSFLISSQVFQVALRALGQRVGVLRLWATAVVAIVISQVFPAGGVGSYAFLLKSLQRRGIGAGETALVATLESVSYAAAMLILAVFGLAYLASRIVAADPNGSSLLAPVLAAGIAALLIGGVVLLLTRSEGTLTHWLLRAHRLLARTLHWPNDATWVDHTVAELTRRRLIMHVVRPRDAQMEPQRDDQERFDGFVEDREREQKAPLVHDEPGHDRSGRKRLEQILYDAVPLDLGCAREQKRAQQHQIAHSISQKLIRYPGGCAISDVMFVTFSSDPTLRLTILTPSDTMITFNGKRWCERRRLRYTWARYK